MPCLVSRQAPWCVRAMPQARRSPAARRGQCRCAAWLCLRANQTRDTATSLDRSRTLPHYARQRAASGHRRRHCRRWPRAGTLLLSSCNARRQCCPSCCGELEAHGWGRVAGAQGACRCPGTRERCPRYVARTAGAVCCALRGSLAATRMGCGMPRRRRDCWRHAGLQSSFRTACCVCWAVLQGVTGLGCRSPSRARASRAGLVYSAVRVGTRVITSHADRCAAAWACHVLPVCLAAHCAALCSNCQDSGELIWYPCAASAAASQR